MGKPFASELIKLDSTLAWAGETNVDSLSGALRKTANLICMSVGSGGSFSSAELQAHYHRLYFGTMAVSCTPMELLLSLPKSGDVSAWFLSASGNNVDICRAFKHTVLQEVKSVNALVGSENSKISKIANSFLYSGLFEFDLPEGKDGFLATNSLIGLSSLLLRGYSSASGKEVPIPPSVDQLLKVCLEGVSDIDELALASTAILKTDRLHVITSPSYKSIAIDIESKFVEAGLGSVHISDIRNFAHGRHHWFDKVSSSSILCLTNSDDDVLGRKTLDLLPDEIPSYQICIKHADSLGPLMGLIISLYLTLWKGENRKIDPGQPRVPRYGSKIYRLSTNPGFETSVSRKEIAIRRKLSSSQSEELRLELESQYIQYTRTLARQKIGGIVFDYDGTLVDPDSRGDPPKERLRAEIVRMLENGIQIGFATGRGKSIREELAADFVLPKKFHNQIVIGYYNGAVIGSLSDNSSPARNETSIDALRRAYTRLSESMRLKLLTPNIESREFQITAEPSEIVSETFLWEYASSLISSEDLKYLKIMRSSHSIDIVPSGVSKISVVDEIQKRLKPGQVVLCLGDRGHWPGNDSELLRHKFSLSVDEISLLKDECWNLCPAGFKGTQGALFYLEKLRSNGKGILQYY